MADEVKGDSPEAVAFALYKEIKSDQKKGAQKVDEGWILETYAKCLDVVKGANPPG